MSQIAQLQALDDRITSAFLAAGMADAATYTAPPVPPATEGTPVACRVYLDTEAAFMGDDGMPVAGRRSVVTLLRAEVPAPVRFAVVALPGATLTLDELIEQDESRTRWVVRRG